MILNHTVEVDAPLARVWALLDNLEEVIPCMPGATFLKRDGDTYEASVKVKVGVIAMDFAGTAKILERNEAERRVTIEGAGKDKKGKGAASATVVAQLTPLDADRTSVSLETDLALSGRIAQFGGSIIGEIASRLIQQFVANLNNTILAMDVPDETPAAVSAPTADTPAAVPTPPPVSTSPSQPAAAPTTPASQPAPRPAAVETAPLDLGELMRPVLKRYAINALFAVVIFVLGFAAGRYF